MRGIMFQFCLIVHASDVEIDALPDGRLLEEEKTYAEYEYDDFDASANEGSWEGEQPGDCAWPDRYVIQVSGTCDGPVDPDRHDPRQSLHATRIHFTLIINRVFI